MSETIANSPLFLDERRNQFPGITNMLYQGFKSQARASMYRSYIFKGEADEYPAIGDDSVSSTELAGQLIDDLGRPIRVLDIGAGACGPLVTMKRELGDNVEVVGLTAHSTGLMPPEKVAAIKNQAVDLRVGNGDFWSRLVKPEERFDLILSHFGLRWFGDPLAATERALSQLNPGGIFWASPLRLPIDTGQDEAFRKALTNAGFREIGAPCFYDRFEAEIRETVLTKPLDAGPEADQPVFHEFSYDNLAISIHRRGALRKTPQQQAYYKFEPTNPPTAEKCLY